MILEASPGEPTFLDLDSRLSSMSIPISTLVEITGIAPDFTAAHLALGDVENLPLGYCDLYGSAVTTIGRAAGDARREAKQQEKAFSRDVWLGDTAVQQQIAEALEPEARRLAMINNLSRFFQREDLPWRDYQRETVLDTLKFMTKGSKEIVTIPELEPGQLQRYGYNDLPTGSGKTVAMALTAWGLGIGSPVSPKYPRPLRAGVVGPTLNILNQTLGDYVRGFSKFAPHINLVRLDGKHPELPEEWDMFGTTYRKMYNMLMFGGLKEYGIDTAFLDEGHHALAKLFRKALMDSGIPMVIAFTATPDYNEERQLKHILPNVLKTVDPRELIERGDLSGLHILEVNTGETFEITGFTREGGFLEEDLEVLSHNPNRNRRIRDTAANFVAEGVPVAISLLPGDDCHHARYMADQLNKVKVTIDGEERYIRAKAIGDFKLPNGKKMTDEQKQKILDEYEAGEIDVICYVDYLDEGWDTTQLGALLLASPTTSIRKQKQRVGRAGRPKEGFPVKWVVEFIDDHITEKQILAIDLYNEGGLEAEFVIGTPDAVAYVFEKRKRGPQPKRDKPSGPRAPARPGLNPGEHFPELSDDIEQGLERTKVLLMEQRRIEAVRESEMPPSDWPSFSELVRSRPDMTRDLVAARLRTQSEVFDGRIRARSLRGNNIVWEIYYPPEARPIVKDYVLPPVADRAVEATIDEVQRESGVSLRRLRRIIPMLVEEGTIPPIQDKRSDKNNRVFPFIPRRDIPIILETANSEEATDERVSVQALAAVLGRSPNILKKQAEEGGLEVADLVSPEGSRRGDYLLGGDIVVIASTHPRIPDVPSPYHKTESELPEMLGMAKKTMRILATSLGITPGRYMLTGLKGDVFAAGCYRPDEIARIAAERDRLGLGKTGLSAEEVVGRRSMWAPTSDGEKHDEGKPIVAPAVQVERALGNLLRSSEARKYLSTVAAHFTPPNEDDEPTARESVSIDGRTLDMLNALDLLHRSQTAQKRSGSGTIGQLAFRLLVGSRQEGRRPRNFQDTVDEIRIRLGARGKDLTEQQVLVDLATELNLFVDSISKPGKPGR